MQVSRALNRHGRAVVARYDALSSACGRANEKALQSRRQISQGATQRVVEAEAKHCAKSCRRCSSAMQQTADWLERLGLGQHAQRFAENDIDTSVLPHLTDENLKELGISLGHRVKLLPAIRELGETLTTVEPTVTPTEPKPQDAAERRQVTVMFSDLVGLRRSQRVWTLRTSARLFPPIRSASPRL